MTDLIAKVLFWACLLPAGSFVAFYAAYSRWWATGVGRIIMGLLITIIYITGLSLVRNLLGDFPGEDVFRIAGYLAINISLWHMVWTLRRIQRSTSKHPLKKKRHHESKDDE